MFLPPFLILGASIVSASNMTLSLLARGPIFSCSILPIAPTDINGLTPCGTGSITAGCDCCDDQSIGCLSPIESCASDSYGNSVCLCNQGYDCSSCDYQGLTDCGIGCLPSGYTCCPDQTYGCPSSQDCCDSGCCDPGSAASSTTAAAAATSSTDAASPTDATSSPAAVFSGGGSAPSSSTSTAPSTTTSSAAGSQRVEGIAAMLFAVLLPALCDVLR